jgi:pimeloyl-ACP methyl ester carboxylesterase
MYASAVDTYDEFSFFHENAEEFGIRYDGPPRVRRERAALSDGRHLSALVWGDGDPEYLFLHGAAQNAHTWDTVLLALGRPAVAVDLPGHGHSDEGKSGYLNVDDHAEDVAATMRSLAPNAGTVVGMSLGGLTTLALAGSHPEMVGRVVLVDVTPGVTPTKASSIAAFVDGPDSFPDFDALLARTIEYNPTRTVSSLRRGILHNAEQREDGTWVWRYARHRGERPFGDGPGPEEFSKLWAALSGLTVPLMLVRGMLAQSVVDDADEAELLRLQPSARIEHVDNAGHSVQGDAPVELARLIADFTQA